MAPEQGHFSTHPLFYSIAWRVCNICFNELIHQLIIALEMRQAETPLLPAKGPGRPRGVDLLSLHPAPPSADVPLVPHPGASGAPASPPVRMEQGK